MTMEGTARVDSDAPSPNAVPAYMTKYGDEMVRLGWSHEQYDEEFPVAIRITFSRVRAGKS